MNTKQKLHQIKLQQWAARFQKQSSSGLTIKAWCTENNITLHTYHYWKHKFKQEYVEASLTKQHDIIPIITHATPSALMPELDFLSVSCQLRDSRYTTPSLFLSEMS